MSTLIGSTRRRLVMLAAVAATAFALTPATGALAATAAPQAVGGHAQSHPTKYHPTQSPPTQSHPTQRACPSAKPGYAACQAIRRTDVPGHRGLFTPTAANPAAAPAGYGPADLQSAYNLPSATAGNGATVAVVDAFDDPAAEADLAVYRQQYGLPACTTANGCFRKVAQDGSTTYPMVDSDWGVEISLDLDMVSATCPNCHILLVEANDDSIASLGAAENEAVALGAKYVSNSWAGPEDPSETAWDTAYFDHPGVAITAAAGDNGYGVSYPSASPYVTAVGGTTLLSDANTPRGWDETAWRGAGSGCSQYEPKPAWQTDSGCANRTVDDVSADADAENSPVAIYDSSPNPGILGGWGAVGGTSAATPIIAATYALAGTPFNGSNPASYPYANASALNDVTSGSDGNCSVDYLCDAGTGYDGPTGLGTPDGTAAFTEKHGDITGTITDAATGQPLAGAIVQSGSATTTTGSDGHYDLSLAAGSYGLTVMDLSGYATQAVSGVQVTDGSTVTESVALRPAANVTLSGTVTDGSGQGWPLYAKVSLPGTPVSAYSDPVTGKYTLSVPQGGTYTLRVDPVYAGYQQAHQSVTVGTSSLTQDLSVPVNGAACTAPGYQTSTPTTLETFDQQTIPPGWSVVNNGDAANTWAFSNPNGIPNYTGWPGNFAAIDPTVNDGTDTELISPVINMTGNAYPVLEFDSGNNWIGAFQDTVEVSIDGGKTWDPAWTSDGISGPVSVPLPQAAGQASVQVAFRGIVPPQSLFFGDIQWWEVADVAISGCGTTPGGLVVGRVADANTGQGVDDATVASADQSGQSGTSSAAGAPGLGGGFYSLFSSLSGSHPFTASAPSYTPAASTVNVVTGQVTRADFTLDAGRLAVTPASVTATGKMGSAATTATVTVTNTGTAPATLGASSQPGGFTVLGQQTAITRGTPAVRSVPVQRVRGQFSPHISKSARTATPAHAGAARAAAQPAAAVPVGTQWVTTAGYPHQTADVATATDPATGKVYTAGGLLNGPLKCDAATNGYVLDPATGAWTSLPAMPHARAGAEAAFIGGKLYVAGGYGIACTAVPGMDVYNPATGQWTSGAAIPNPYYGAGSAVVGGKMYVVGGCDSGYGVCGMTNVQVYNPASNTWTTAAPYPVQTAWLGCGGIGGKLYCAGGASDYSGTTSAGYVYDPATNAWSEIASLPIDLWGGADTVANGQLLISGGVTSNSTVVTNQGYAYDPATGTWTALPNAPTATYRAAGACGFYRIGGFGPNLVANVDQLPGYGDCGGDPWLSASPATTTLQPGQSTKVTVTLNAADPSISQPGTYTAALRLGSDTPYGATTIPVQFTVNPPGTWGGIAGTVSGRACNGTTAPLPGATVQVTGAHGSWVLGTEAGGQYSLWLDTTNNPLTVIVSATGWKPQAATVTLTKQSTTTRDFTLTTTASCT